MKYIEKISKLFNIDEIYIGLILKTIIIIFLILVVEKIGIRIIKRTRDSKKEYNYTKKYKLIAKVFETDECVIGVVGPEDTSYSSPSNNVIIFAYKWFLLWKH